MFPSSHFPSAYFPRSFFPDVFVQEVITGGGGGSGGFAVTSYAPARGLGLAADDLDAVELIIAFVLSQE